MVVEHKQYGCKKCGMKFDKKKEAISHENLPMSSVKLKVPGMYGFIGDHKLSFAYAYYEEKGNIRFDSTKQEHTRTYFARFFESSDFSPCYLGYDKATAFVELSEEDFKELIEGLRSIENIDEKLKHRFNGEFSLKLEEMVRGEVLVA